MRLALQERLLPAHESIPQRIETAQALGFAGIEFDAHGLDERIEQIGAALHATGIQAAGVNIGGTHLLHPDFDQRDAAIASIRQAMADALDLGASGAVFRTHRADTPPLPDLRPYQHVEAMTADFLISQLRSTLADLAYAMGAELYLQPTHRYETPLLHRLEQAASILHQNDDHPHIKLAAHTYHMALEESDPVAALQAYAGRCGVVHLADHHGGFPGTGLLDFPAIIAALREARFEGWLVLAYERGTFAQPALKTCAAYLRDLLQTNETE